LELFGLDLNPYLMVAQPAGGAGAVEIAAIDVDVAGWNEAGLDFSGLKALNANVELTISGPLKVQAMQVDSLKADVTAVDGVLTASLSQMQLYGGLGAGRFALNARDMPMTIAHELAVERVRADSFLEALIGFNQLSAPASVRFALASSGGTQKALLENLRGEGSFQFAEGVLRGVDFGGVSRTIGNLIDGKLIGPNAQTPFRGFSAGFKIQQGIAATRDFTLEGQGMRLTALGTIDIGKQTMSLRLSPATVFSSGPDGRTSTGAPLPFVIKGPWTKPEFSIDLLGGARSQVERNVCGVLGQVPGARQRPC
jgi:AsmA protein